MMNDRIREPYYSFMYNASIGWNEFLFQVPPELLEKYSELIIKECAKLVEHILKEGGGNQGDLIKERFGVEWWISLYLFGFL